jgi:hypothetical protein
MLNIKVNSISFKDAEPCSSHRWTNKAKPARVFEHAVAYGVNFFFEPVAQARLFAIVPVNSCLELKSCRRFENYSPRHATFFFRRCSSSERTVSNGMPRSGCRRRSSARRSSSATCCGVSSGLKPYPSSARFSSSWFSNSARSSIGSALAFSSSSAALVHQIYPNLKANQVVNLHK